MKKLKNSNKWLIISLVLFLIFISSTVSVLILIFRFPSIIGSSVNIHSQSRQKRFTESADITGIDIIDIKCDVADISVEKYKGKELSVEYEAKDNSEIKLQSSNGKLTVNASYEKVPSINFDFLMQKNIKLKIMVPESYDKEIDIDNNMGDIYAKGSFTKAKLIVDLGDIISEIDAQYLEIYTNAGSSKISGKINSSKIESDRGDISYKPVLNESGEHILKTDMGIINLELEPESNVTVVARISVGDIINEFRFSNIINNERKDSASHFVAYNGKGESKINIESDTGEINIK